MTHSVHDVNSLIECLKSTNAVSRSHARHHLLAIGHSTVPALVKLLTDPVQHVRWKAAKVLEGIADVAAVPALIDALGDSDNDVAWVAGEALGAIGERARARITTSSRQQTATGRAISRSVVSRGTPGLRRLGQARADHRFDRLLKSDSRPRKQRYMSPWPPRRSSKTLPDHQGGDLPWSGHQVWVIPTRPVESERLSTRATLPWIAGPVPPVASSGSGSAPPGDWRKMHENRHFVVCEIV